MISKAGGCPEGLRGPLRPALRQATSGARAACLRRSACRPRCRRSCAGTFRRGVRAGRRPPEGVAPGLARPVAAARKPPGTAGRLNPAAGKIRRGPLVDAVPAGLGHQPWSVALSLLTHADVREPPGLVMSGGSLGVDHVGRLASRHVQPTPAVSSRESVCGVRAGRRCTGRRRAGIGSAHPRGHRTGCTGLPRGGPISFSCALRSLSAGSSGTDRSGGTGVPRAGVSRTGCTTPGRAPMRALPW